MILFTIANASLWGTVGGASLSHVPSCPNPPGHETQEVQCLIFCSVRQLIPKTIQIAMPSVCGPQRCQGRAAHRRRLELVLVWRVMEAMGSSVPGWELRVLLLSAPRGKRQQNRERR